MTTAPILLSNWY